MRNRRALPWGVCALLLWTWLLPAAELARIPYELIYQIQKTQDTLSHSFTNLHMYLRMSSTQPQVAIRDLSVAIDCKDGPIPVPLNPTNGNFSLPMRDSLVAEGATVVVNQPKGTMTFGWYVGLKVAKLPVNGIHYREMMQPLKDLEAIRVEMEKVPGSPPMTIVGLKFMYPPDKEAAVTIHARSGDRVFKTNPKHALVIPYEPALLEEDPQVSIPLPPDKVDVADPGP